MEEQNWAPGRKLERGLSTKTKRNRPTKAGYATVGYAKVLRSVSAGWQLFGVLDAFSIRLYALHMHQRG